MEKILGLENISYDKDTFRTLLENGKAFRIDESISIARNLFEEFADIIPADYQEDLFARIEQAHDIFNQGLPNGETRDSAFLVHPRDSAASIEQGIYYGDADGVFPALPYMRSSNRKQNQEIQKQKLALLNSLPPFEAAVTHGRTMDGQDLYGSIICIPLDIDKMLNMPSASARLKDYARPLIQSATDFVSTKLGTKNIGLGEQIAALTQFGQLLEKNSNEKIYTTTGHAGTIFAMAETLKLGAQKLGIDLSSETVGIIGCGRIGSAFAEYAESLHMAGNLIFYDKASGVAEKLADDIIKNRAKQNGHKVEIANNYEEVLDKTRLIVSAVSDPMLGELPLNNHFVVDDSQPPWVPPQNSSGIIAWPSYTMPETVTRNGIRILSGNRYELIDEFNYGSFGLIPRTDWGCNVELNSLLMTNCMESGHISRAATKMDVANLGELITKAGFYVQTLQSWGNAIPEESFLQLRSNI